ncbi:MAG TPA: hypothetical protein DDZ41_11365 [Flavobacterium sp.]|nr:hypothetical protein [Flavobacterium sp.]
MIPLTENLSFNKSFLGVPLWVGCFVPAFFCFEKSQNKKRASLHPLTQLLNNIKNYFQIEDFYKRNCNLAKKK